METITLNGNEYTVKSGEFVIEPHLEYNYLHIFPELARLERIVGLINDLTENHTNSYLSVYGWTHGGFIPIQCSKLYKNVFVYSHENIVIASNMPSNIYFNIPNEHPHLIYVTDLLPVEELQKNPYIICTQLIADKILNFFKFPIVNSNLVLCVPLVKFNEFNAGFRYYFDNDNNFNYDNLIHLCIMVKNGGELFEKVLTENLPIIDRWTILDTGSTDGTQDIVRKVLKNKKGQLFEEPFINFRDSRNRCLDLAGNNCKYNLMLDDTYIIRNNLRSFLNTVRGDQFASSFSLLILSDDVEYYSNRITISERKLRYMYKIHEVIQDTNNDTNVVVPKNAGFVEDLRAPYMEKRTMDRKMYDLKLLYEMVQEDPQNPRHYYYLAQTYNLLEDYNNAAFWFHKRATSELKGHKQEAVDSWFELARIYNFKLNRPWNDCEEIYKKAYEADPSRPEALYFIGIHYFLEGNKALAFEYFSKAFAIGYPIHAQFSLKPTLSYHFNPKFLTPLCYEFNDSKLGFESAKYFLEHNRPESDQYAVMLSWYNIFQKLCLLPEHPSFPIEPVKPLLVFVADGNWNQWTGKDILTKGLGGSETYVVEISKAIQATGQYDCIVFCNCAEVDTFEDVKYIPLSKYADFIMNNKIHTVVVSRFSEYIPMTLKGFVENVHLLLHDLGPTGIIIPLHNKLKNVICLTGWHEQYFLKNFPQFQERTQIHYYGVDTTLFKPHRKIPNSFIYSSFPNRGLLPLLQMWPSILKIIPDATLHIYSDINGKWVNEVAKEQMDEIRNILQKELQGVTVHGWVSKKELARAWSTADIWLYPCIFEETFCLTALEAAATKTLAIGPPLAALQETIGERGILVPGNPTTSQWQENVLKILEYLQLHPESKELLIQRNYNWAINTTWKKQGELFIRNFLEWRETVKNTDDFKHILLETFNKIGAKHVLEVGAHNGKTLIEMLSSRSDCLGVAVDTWELEDIESQFNQNVRNAEMYSKIIKFKGDISNSLVEICGLQKEFDIITIHNMYQNFNHITYYNYIIVAWILLKSGGYLCIDNSMKINDTHLVEVKLNAIKHFKDTFSLSFNIIYDSTDILFIHKL